MSFLKNKAGLVLAGLGITGVIGTGVSSALATPKAIERLRLKEEEKGELNFGEKVLAMAPSYIPSLLIGGSTILCVAALYGTGNKAQQSLSSALALIESSYIAYREKNIELFGVDNDKEIVDMVAAEEYYRYKDIEEELENDDSAYFGDTMFYDAYSNKFFKSNFDNIKQAEYQINKSFGGRGYCELNEYYEFLGKEPTNHGHVIGWSMDAGLQHGYDWIVIEYEEVVIFGACEDEDVTYYNLNFRSVPTSDFMDWRYARKTTPNMK